MFKGKEGAVEVDMVATGGPSESPIQVSENQIFTDYSLNVLIEQ